MINYNNFMIEEDYNSAKKILEISQFFLNLENAFFIYNITKAINITNDDSIEIQTSPVSQGSFKIRIEQLATNQIIRGKEFLDYEISNIQEGDYAYSIKYKGKNYFVNLKILSEHTNFEIISQLIESINNLKLPITAKVENHLNNIYILISANDTGLENSFFIKDMVGDIIKKYIGDISENQEQAKNSIFYINDKLYDFPTNEFYIEDYNIKVILKKANLTEQKIEIVKDFDTIYHIIVFFVQKISEFIEKLGKKTDAHSNLIISNMFDELLDNSEKLKNVGINIDYKLKKIIVEYEQLKNAIKNNINEIINVFSAANGFTQLVNKKITEYLQMPFDLYSPYNINFEEFQYIPYFYNIYNPYEFKINILKL